MTPPVLIRHAGQLLTLAGPPGPRRGLAMRDLGVVSNGAVLVDAGRIVSAGPEADVERLARAKEVQEIDAHGRVVMPGFIDSHTHLVFGPPRLNDFEMRLGGADYQAIAKAGGGIRSTMWDVRSTSVIDLAMRTRRRLDEFARHGTTTLEAKSGYGLDEEAERKTLRLMRDLNGQPLDIVPTYLGAHVTPPEFDGRSDEYIDWMIGHMLPALHQERLAEFVDVYIDQGGFTREQARRCLIAARGLGFGLRVHAEQFTRTGATTLACELGAASADHLEQATVEEADVLAGSETVATLLPGSVFHLSLQRYAPGRLLIDRGAAVALATDFNPGTSPTCSMPMIIVLACRMMKMTIAEAITAVTVNAAAALRRSRRVGALEPGREADLIVLNAEDYRELAYWFGANPVALTIKGGQVVYEEQPRTPYI